MQSVSLTIDGQVPSSLSRCAMRWLPPEQAAAVRARLGAEMLAEAGGPPAGPLVEIDAAEAVELLAALESVRVREAG